MSEAQIFSDHWYRVESLRPRLASNLHLDRHRVRGQSWWILASEDGRRSHRLDGVAYALVGRCNGLKTVGQIWESLNAKLGDAAATQDDFIQILSRLHTEGWLNFDSTPDLSGLLTERRRRARSQRAFNPLALRIPLGDPQRLLSRLDPLARAVISKPAMWVWCALTLVGVLVGLSHLDGLVAHGATWLATPRYVVITWCVYPVIKLLHELAHGFAVRRWGGQVRQAGVTLLMFTPVPFVDASAASLFPRSGQRAMVSLAGVMAELAIATVGLLLWVMLGPGLIRDIAFISVVIGCVSTLAVNANPLLRFDGYFALCDLLGLPNLASRSRSYWGQLLRDHLLKMPTPERLRLAPGEKGWLIAFAPLSWLYQLTLALLIARWVAGISPIAGLAAGIAFVALLVGRPVVGVWRFIRDPSDAVQVRRSALLRASLACGALIAGVTLLPLPYRTVAEGVVWLPERSLVRAGEDGFVEELLVQDGQVIEPGQLLARMSNPSLSAEQKRLIARRDGLESQRYAAMGEDAGSAEQLRESLSVVNAELKSATARVAALELRADAGGRLVMPKQSDVVGGFARRGRLLAYVLTDESPFVRIAVPQDRAELIRLAEPKVEVLLAQARGRIHRGVLGRDTLSASQQLPSAALSASHGGQFVTDPADKEHRRALSPVVTMDVRLANTTLAWLGERAWVRFEHGYRPLLFRWARSLQQSFMQRDQAGTR